MQVTNMRPYAVELVATGQTVGAGETVEVPDDVGKSLKAQPDVWAVTGAGSGRPSVKEVLAEVGNDTARAARALAVEKQSDDPRKSLVSRLEEIAATEEQS